MGTANGNGGDLARRLKAMADEDGEDDEDWRKFARDLRNPLDPSNPDEMSLRMLRVARAMRTAGVLTGGAAHFAVAFPIVRISERRSMLETNPALDAFAAQMKVVEKSYGLTDDQYWPLSEAPVEYLALSHEYSRVLDEITAATFEEFGEFEIARMYRFSRAQHDGLYEEGRRFFFEKDPSEH